MGVFGIGTILFFAYFPVIEIQDIHCKHGLILCVLSPLKRKIMKIFFLAKNLDFKIKNF